jgi:hypothetical protein
MKQIYVCLALALTACSSSQTPPQTSDDAAVGEDTESPDTTTEDTESPDSDACVPDCAGRECGMDPVCGTSCGACASGKTCSAAGRCMAMPCVPDCGMRECGSDPVCGTKSCGVCPTSGKPICNAGVCVSNVASIAVSPTKVTVVASKSTWFESSVKLAGPSGATTVTWSVTESGGGSVTATGVYTAPATPGTYHVVATSDEDKTKTASAEVTVVAPDVRVIVGPSLTTLAPGGRVCFRSLITDTTDQRVAWSAVGGGTMASDGCYTAPTTAGSYEIEAAATADSTKKGRAKVNVVAAAVPLKFDSALRWAGTCFGCPSRVEEDYVPLLIASPGQLAHLYGSDAKDEKLLPTVKVDETGGGSVTTNSFSSFGVGQGGFALNYTAPMTAGLYHVSASRPDDARVVISAPVIVRDGGFRTISAKLPTPHWRHRITLLADGRVLVSGGQNFMVPGNVAELVVVDPRTLTASTFMLKTARFSHTATTLNDGRVLIAGGGIDGSAVEATSTVEIFDPAKGTVSDAPALSVKRRGHFAVKLTDGKVLVGGGGSVTLETFDPSTSTWSLSPAAIEKHPGKGAALMPDGRVLLVGGHTLGAVPSKDVSIYDPKTQVVTSRTSCPLGGSPVKILPAGGSKYLLLMGDPAIGSAEVRQYDDATASCTDLPLFKNRARWIGFDGVNLKDGRIALLGGNHGNTAYNHVTVADLEIYDPVRQTLTPSARLKVSRSFGDYDGWDGAVTLDDGRVFVAGGFTATWKSDGLNTDSSFVDSLELWSP